MEVLVLVNTCVQTRSDHFPAVADLVTHNPLGSITAMVGK